MSAIPKLTEDEMYLLAILDDPSGIELAEFLWVDEEQDDGCFRLWDFQWKWFRCDETYQIDWAGRSLGKSTGIIMRAFAFPFNYPGAEMLITAPELNHLRPITDKVEHLLLTTRLGREMLPRQRGNGINHQPQFQALFANNSRIISRLPQRTGKGVKGCVAAGTLVLTRAGQVPIEDVRVGDEVLSHTGVWRRVLACHRFENPDAIEVCGGGLRSLVMSDNHRMYGRRNGAGPKERRSFEAPEWWIPGVDATPASWHLASPTMFPEEVVPAGVTAELLWVVGRYVADGFLTSVKKRQIRTSRRLHIIAKESDVAEIERRMIAAALRPTSRRRAHNGTYDIEVSSGWLCELTSEHFGKLAEGKKLPVWMLGAEPALQRAFLDGYLSGDGSWDAKKERWTATTASKALAVSLRLMVQSLGYAASMTWVDPKVTHIAGRALVRKPRRSYRVLFSERTNVNRYGRNAFAKVHSVRSTECDAVYDLSVDEDCSYIADGLVSHNMHPLVIESDEMQDFPPQGWIELIETMKVASRGAQWRAHGVSRGVRDAYYKYTMRLDPEMPFYVHRYMAMHRPSWSDEERRRKIAQYNGTDQDVDYRRNIYGDHGDATNPVFVLAHLMACVKMEQDQWALDYNETVYKAIKLTDELLQRAGSVEPFLTVPENHFDDTYFSYWAGQDVGYTRDPSEILLCGELTPKKGAPTMLRLLLRVQMQRISAADQAQVVRWVFETYGRRLRGFTFDKTGNGLPLWQELDPQAAGTTRQNWRTPEHITNRIKGYGFSQKVAVEFDDREPVGDEKPEDLVIKKNVVDFATDELRKLVDSRPPRLELPNDRELLTEFMGQEIQYTRDEGSAAGIQRRYSGGSFHTLDAAKMMIAGRNLEAIEQTLKVKTPTPVLDRIGF